LRDLPLIASQDEFLIFSNTARFLPDVSHYGFSPTLFQIRILQDLPLIASQDEFLIFSNTARFLPDVSHLWFFSNSFPKLYLARSSLLRLTG